MRNILLIFYLLLVVAGCEGRQASSTFGLKEDFIIIAHRGASADAPEHTFPAYELAAISCADYIEVDLQMSKDGELIALHDRDVDRTTNGSGRASSLTLKEIKALDAASWFNAQNYSSYKNIKIPTLEEIFQRFGSTINYYIETKSPGMESKLIQLLKEYSIIDSDSKVIIQSFNRESLKEIHRMEPGILLVQLYKLNNNEELTNRDFRSLERYASGIGVDFSAVDEDFVKKAYNHGLAVHLFTVNMEEDFQHAVEIGADGVFTDYPERFRNKE